MLTAATACLTMSCSPAAEQAGQQFESADYLIYFGTSTRGEAGSKGIYVSQYASSTGEFSAPELAAEAVNPSWVTIHPNGEFLYAVGETYGDAAADAGAVSAFRINRPDGTLTLLNTVSSMGKGPCHLAIDRTAKMLAVANYGGGSVASYPVNADGTLGEAATFHQHESTGPDPRRPDRPRQPRGHSVDFSADNRFLVSCDLGLDEIFVYPVDPAAATFDIAAAKRTKVADGAGPRHFAFHPSAKFGYVINELGSTITAFTYDAQAGALSEVQTVSTLPEDFTGRNSTAEIVVHPSGKYVYGSNRGHNSIAAFAIDEATGQLTLIEREPTLGEIPRNFAIDPTAAYVLAGNQNTGNVVQFGIADDGSLTPTGRTMPAPAPICIQFVKADL